MPNALKPVIENPTGYAGNAIQDARYDRFEIRTRGGMVEIETTTRDGTRVRTYGSADQLQSGMERDGINAFLTAQVRDQQAVLSATVDALWMGRDESVLRIEPERLTRTRAEVAPLAWLPAVRGGNGPGDDSRKRIEAGNEPPPEGGPKPAQGAAADQQKRAGDSRER